MTEQSPAYLTGFAPAERTLDELLAVLLHGEPYQASRAAEAVRAKFAALDELLQQEQAENEYLRELVKRYTLPRQVGDDA